MLAVWSARTLVKRGQLVAASELYRQATLLTPNDLWVGNAQQQAQADAAKELGELQPRIPKLRVQLDGAAPNDVVVTIDNVALATALLGFDLPSDPGSRHIVGKRGAQIVEQTVNLNEGDRKDAVLKFNAATPSSAIAVAPLPAAQANQQAAAPALVPQVPQGGLPLASTPTLTETQPAPSTRSARRTWGWVALGVGAAGLLTGVVAGIDVLANSDLRGNCPNGICNPSKVQSDSLRSYNSMRSLSTVGFIVGGVGTAVGVTLFLWTPKQEQAPSMALWLGPSSAGVQGAF
jgi:hypothetical protein